MALACFVLAGCGKSDKEAGSASPEGDDKSAAGNHGSETAKPGHTKDPSKPDLPWDTDYSDEIAKLQGSWVVKGFGSYGSIHAWKFDGAKVTIYDPEKKTEKPDVLIFSSPCDVRLDSGYGGTLVIDGDDVYLGLGDGGWKEGDTIIACMTHGTVYATPTACVSYDERFGRVETVETTCSQPEGRFVAVQKPKNGKERERSLRFRNERVLLSDQLAENKIQKYPDWDAAKAAADKLLAERK